MSRFKLDAQGFVDAETLVREAWRDGFALDPVMTVSEWADRYRKLSSESSSEAGPWRTARVPYMRDVMDALSSHSTYERVVLMSGTQLSKTETGNNWMGYTIHISPAPMLIVLPTLEMARMSSRQRISPMLRDTDVLAARVAEARSRDSGNTVLMKEFDGGVIRLAGANSPVGLRSMPVERLFLDEVDAYPMEVGSEGDPVALAEARTETFSWRKIYMCSTPTVKGLSRIEKAFLLTDQRRYFIPCPACGTYDWLQWQVGGWNGREGRHHHIVFENRDPTTARMCCSACDERIAEHHKDEMLAQGSWEPTAAGAEPKTIGFHLSALYSPLGWKSWGDCVDHFLRARQDVSQLKTFVNTVLGETWDEPGSSVDADSLQARREAYPAEIPLGVGVLVSGTDVHPDRLETYVWGFGAGEESWLIGMETFRGDPGKEVGPDSPWPIFDSFLRRLWDHESGQQMRIECATIDLHGGFADQVYRFCHTRRARRVFAVRGGSVAGTELVTRPSTGNRYKLPLFTLGVDTGKDTIVSRLRIPERGAGFIHLPEWADDEVLAQLTAEKAIRKYVRGKGSTRSWVKTRDRNEALDCAVYALAALRILGTEFIRGLGARAARFAIPVGAPAAAPTPGLELPAAPPGSPQSAPTKPSRRPTRSSWVNSWKS